MKRLLTVLTLGATFVLGQTITPIADIQFVADPATDDASPLVGQTVTVSGVVTAEFWGSTDNKYFRVQDADTAWSGITIYNSGGWDTYSFSLAAGGTTNSVSEGDSVTVTGEVYESFTMTRIRNTTNITIHGAAVNPPAPMQIATGSASAEKYESVLIKVVAVDIVNPDLGFGEWGVSDGSSDTLVVDDKWGYYYYPKAGGSLASITGTLDFSFGDYKLQPRLAADVVEAGEFVRIQRIQQVRGSDLIKAPFDAVSDTSYLRQDTVSVTGVVAMPTGLSFAGDGVKFNLADIHGGPWSGIMFFNPDSTGYPVLFEGDSIKATGWVDEYQTGPSGMTEFWIVGPITVLGVGATVPMPELVTTGDLRLPITAEQWGTVMVEVQNAWVVDNALSFGEWSIDDGTGSVNVDDDSDSLSNFVRPPNGTAIQSVTGWVYHHFGSYDDSTAYKIEPLYVEDIVIGGGPPTITDYSVAMTAFGPTDAVTVSANMVDGSAVASADIQYRVGGGAWTAAAMTQGTGEDALVWTGTIPATNTEGALVEYFLVGTDDGGDNQDAAQSAVFPDTSQRMFGYHTKAAGQTIADIQMAAYPAGDSYYAGAVVTVSGVITALPPDVEDRTDPEPWPIVPGFVIQSASGAWNGVSAYLNDATSYTPVMGDEITVTGTVDEDWAAYSFMFSKNTVIRDISVVTVTGSGMTIAATTVTGADLLAEAESFEGVLVTIDSVSVTSLNSFDWSVSDGTGEFLIDDDWLASTSAADTMIQNLAVGDVILGLGGIYNHSFGSIKVQIRDLEDLGVELGVERLADLPTVFSLSQNYPNPFNPATTINYTLPRQTKHTLKVYNLLGAEVATLVSDTKPAGAYSITWNAQRFASGLYFIRLEAGDYNNVKKMVLLK